MTKHFLDVGSNTGTTFDWLATQPHDYSDHVMWLFEPSPRHFAALIEKAKAMSGKYKDIRLCPFGLGGISRVAPLFEKDDPQGDSFSAVTTSDHTPKNIDPGYMVFGVVNRAASFINSAVGPQDEIVLDIDAEGSEYGILDSILTDQSSQLRDGVALTAKIRRLMVEFHFVNGRDCREEKARLIAGFANLGIAIECRGSVP